MRLLFAVLATAVLILATTVTVNTLRLPGPPPLIEAPSAADFDLDAALERLAGAIRIPTISFENEAAIDRSQWRRLHAHLASSFPRVHAALERETVSDYSLLYTWRGLNSQLDPILLLAHQDVVPIEPGSESRWVYPPFSGAISEGYLWGRGAIDDKGSLVAILEAVEWLLAQGFTPERTVMLAFGHDEEVGGMQGARQIAALLAERDINLWFSLDEGAAVMHGATPGVASPVAFLNLAEKGYLTLILSAQGEEGHSSMPPPQTAVGRLARAVARVQDAPMPQRLLPEVVEGLQRTAHEMPWMQRVAVANPWLFSPLIRRELAGQRSTHALTRTTTAPTMLEAGIKDNILPTQARAVINFRILPGDSIEDVEAHVRRVIDDPGIGIERGPMISSPSPVADIHGPAFAAIERSIREVFTDALVVPSIVMAGTDNRHFVDVRDNGYYFMPLRLEPRDLQRIHGTNERISVTNYAEMVRFYTRLIRNTTGADLVPNQ